MGNDGWIKTYRKIQDCWIWQIDKPFDERSAWIDLLLSTNHRDTKIPFNGELKLVCRGQYMTSIRKLSEKWKWNKDKVLKFLRLLESDGMITKNSDRYRTLITIENYCIYQDKESQFQTQQGTEESTRIGTLKSTPQGTADVHEPATNKNIKNDKNEKKERKNTFHPPTVDEVREYLQSVGSSIDPEAFVAFYESKGWMVGKNKMKSWKMAIVTWEKTKGLKRELPKEEVKEDKEEIYRGDDW